MRVFLALVRKGLLDGRWTLGLASLALFGLSWLFVMSASRIETAIATAQAEGRAPRMGMLRGMGGASMDFSTAAIQMAFWNNPFVVLLLAIWLIGRGAASVGGELERGSMDIVMSRPISRSAYLISQVATALIGLALMIALLAAGNLIGGRYYSLNQPLTLSMLWKPALNLGAMGLVIFGYTFLVSTVDSVRWRPLMAGSVLTLAGFILRLIANLPSMEDWKWMEKLSIFKAYDPVEIVVKGETFLFNTGILSAVGGACLLLGFVLFARRDLPTPG